MNPIDWINGGWRQSPYAKTIVGVGYGIDQDGLYGFQCKDFSNAYAIYYDAPFTSGNAITLWTVPQVGWTKEATPKVGDVFVRNAVFNSVNYGDTGCVQEVTDTGVWVIQQNLQANLYQGSPPARMFWRFDQLLGYLRKDTMNGAPDGGTVSNVFLDINDRVASPQEHQDFDFKSMNDQGGIYYNKIQNDIRNFRADIKDKSAQISTLQQQLADATANYKPVGTINGVTVYEKV